MANTTWSTTDKGASITLTGSNLIATSSSAGSVRAADRQASGKFYWEYTYNITTANSSGAGVANAFPSMATTSMQTQVGACILVRLGLVYVDGVNVSGISFGTIANGTVVCVAVDCTARLIWFRLGAAGNWNASASANPATGAGGVTITNFGIGLPVYPAASMAANGDQTTANFGNSAFTGSAPSGFTAGFTAGASIPTNALATVAAAEQWINANADARMTSIFLEHWGPAGTSQPQAVATLVALEQWMTVGATVTAQARAWILA